MQSFFPALPHSCKICHLQHRSGSLSSDLSSDVVLLVPGSGPGRESWNPPWAARQGAKAVMDGLQLAEVVEVVDLDDGSSDVLGLEARGPRCEGCDWMSARRADLHDMKLLQDSGPKEPKACWCDREAGTKSPGK